MGAKQVPTNHPPFDEQHIYEPRSEKTGLRGF